MKNKLRKKIRNLRENLSIEEVLGKSERTCNKLIETNIYKNAKIIMSYMSIKNELNTQGLNAKILSDKKKLYLPVIDKKYNMIVAREVEKLEKISKGMYNIPEPSNGKIIDKNKIDLIIVPGLVFDKNGNRIGFGMGYYDRFLKDYNGKTIGLCYKFQIVETIISEAHDEKLDMLCSEDGIITLNQ